MYIRPLPPSWRRFVLQVEIYNGHLPDESAATLDRLRRVVCLRHTSSYITDVPLDISRYIFSHYFASDTRHRLRYRHGHRIALYRIVYRHSHRNSARFVNYTNIVLTDYSQSKALAQSRVGSAAAVDPDSDCVSSRRADRGTGSRRVPILVDLGRNARGRRSVEYTCRRRRRWGRGGRRREGILFDVRRRCTTMKVHGEPKVRGKHDEKVSDKRPEINGEWPLTRAAVGTMCAVNAGLDTTACR